MPPDQPAFPKIPGQHGLATYRQLREAGWTEAQIRHRRATSWQTPYPGVVVPHRGPVAGPELLTALALWAGPAAVLTGLTALSLHAVKAPPPAVATFLVPQTARAREHGLARSVRTCRQPRVALRDGLLAVAPAARALVDAVCLEATCLERLRPSDLEALTITILQRGLATVEELDAELWQRPQAAVTSLRSGLESFTQGAWSRPEAVLRRLWDAHPSLPELLTNRTLVHTPTGRFLGCPDGYLPTLGVAIQVHSRQYHQGIDDQGGDRWAATVEKDSAMVGAGLRVLGVTPWTLHAQPRRFLARVEQLVELGPPAPMPLVRHTEPAARR
ncbi:hypothetical protein ACI3EY_15770 [Ornithinimicrobium sp. LYQ92]|uniref:hypothetical protein n=1 Tax=Serinicoccus sp. LYQ92 TaxID=3378798 RepID=UPI003852CC7D